MAKVNISEPKDHLKSIEQHHNSKDFSLNSICFCFVFLFAVPYHKSSHQQDFCFLINYIDNVFSLSHNLCFFVFVFFIFHFFLYIRKYNLRQILVKITHNCCLFVLFLSLVLFPQNWFKGMCSPFHFSFNNLLLFTFFASAASYCLFIFFC